MIAYQWTHRTTSNNFDAVDEKGGNCAHCEQQVLPRTIVKTCDSGKTALCPYCGVDSIVPFSAVDWSLISIAELREEWFDKPATLID